MFTLRLLASAVASSVALVYSAGHALLLGFDPQDAVVGVPAGSALLYLAYKAFQDDTVSRRERRLFLREIRFERRAAWDAGRRGVPLAPYDDVDAMTPMPALTEEP